MKELFVKQQLFSLRGRYEVFDVAGHQIYQAEGSFMKIAKEFYIKDMMGNNVATVSKELFKWLPQFQITVGGREIATLKREFTFFKPSYTLLGTDIQIRGDIWSMSFEILNQGQVIGRIDQKWMTIRDQYRIEVLEDECELIVLGIVLAIDYVKALERNNGA